MRTLISHRFHVWLRPRLGRVRFGLASGLTHLIDESAEIEHAAVGSGVRRGVPLALLETAGQVFVIHSPLTGMLVHVNGTVLSDLSIAADDPYGEGWLGMIRPLDWEAEKTSIPGGSKLLERYKAYLSESEKRGEDVFTHVR